MLAAGFKTIKSYMQEGAISIWKPFLSAKTEGKKKKQKRITLSTTTTPDVTTERPRSCEECSSQKSSAKTSTPATVSSAACQRSLRRGAR